MKKIPAFVCIFSLLLLVACQSEKLKITEGRIKATTDTTIVVKIDNYDICFNTKQAKYDNGAVMPGDSVAIHYVGDLRTKKVVAAIVKLIPAQGNYVEASYDPSKKLETRPMNDIEKERMKTFVEDTKRLREKGGK